MGWLRLALGKGHPTSRAPSLSLALPWLPQAGAGGPSMEEDSSLAQCPDVYDLGSQG